MDDPILWDNRRREDAIGIYNEIKRILEGIHFEKVHAQPIQTDPICINPILIFNYLDPNN